MGFTYINPITSNALSDQKQPHNFDDISQEKAKSGKYLMEKCQSEQYLILTKIILNIKVIFKSIIDPKQQFLEELSSINGLNSHW